MPRRPSDRANRNTVLDTVLTGPILRAGNRTADPLLISAWNLLT